MKNFKQLHHFKPLALLSAAFLLGASLMPALVAGFIETIQVRNGIQLNLNGEQVIPTDASGRQRPVFLYQNTTYVPVRYISEQYGKDVAWDGENATVYITDRPEANEDSASPDLDQAQPENAVSLIDYYPDHGTSQAFGVSPVKQVKTISDQSIDQALLFSTIRIMGSAAFTLDQPFKSLDMSLDLYRTPIRGSVPSYRITGINQNNQRRALAAGDLDDTRSVEVHLDIEGYSSIELFFYTKDSQRPNPILIHDAWLS